MRCGISSKSRWVAPSNSFEGDCVAAADEEFHSEHRSLAYEEILRYAQDDKKTVCKGFGSR